MSEVEGWVRLLLGAGLESRDITIVQMGLRAALVYLVTLLIVRMAKKRFMGRATAFDVILGIMLGSIVSRAVTGNAPLLPALAAAAVLVGMHWIFSWISLRWHGFGHAIKGEALILVRDGHVDEDAMRRAHMTDKDLWEDLRAKSMSSVEQVSLAHLERSGELSVIKARADPKVVEVRIADGVQTVRIEFGS
ncbi:DUF421 domain-containing protein [Microvirga massiliensis]|uniref:DUF421 domain-containing protein n=1 Tax=Microvirga massiliensis TaxID=1033741 RepID=UPI00062B395C|nr:YetF domain-containing protein [Microvirga massiliensis]